MNNAEKQLSNNKASVRKLPRIQRKRIEMKTVKGGRY